MRVLILGGAGMLGHRMWATLGKSHEVYGTLRTGENKKLEKFNGIDCTRAIGNIDVLNEESLASAFEIAKPDVVINCIGILKVQDSIDNRLLSVEVNSLLPHKIAKLSKKYNSRFIHFSTDCVFDGVNGMYEEDSREFASDLYGHSKKLGEVEYLKTALTIRTSIIGREITPRGSLVEWFLSESSPVKGFNKAIFSGYPTNTISKIVNDYVIGNESLNGVVHISNDPVDKYTLLKKINEKFNLNKTIEKNVDFIIDRSLDSSLFRKLTGLKSFSLEELMDDLSIDWEIYDSITEDKKDDA